MVGCPGWVPWVSFSFIFVEGLWVSHIGHLLHWVSFLLYFHCDVLRCLDLLCGTVIDYAIRAGVRVNPDAVVIQLRNF